METETVAKELEAWLEKLKTFTSTPGRGVTRLPFTREAREALEYLKLLMGQAGLAVREEESGALVGRLEGRKGQAILIGSHYDSVVNGGAYDGIAGVACGIALAGYLTKNHIIPEYSLEVAAFNDEEGVRFHTGYLSSKAMLGGLNPAYLKEHRDGKGTSVYDAMAAWGKDPERIGTCRRKPGEIAWMAEIHIEQGPVLENWDRTLGIVDTIVGIRRFEVRIRGRSDHAGTTPMALRDDALVKAAPAVTQIRAMAAGTGDMVATVGEFSVYPGAINIVPEQVVFTVDIRSADEKALVWASEELRQILDRSCGGDYDLTATLTQEPMDMDARLGRHLEECIRARGYPYMHLNSGAGHDSLEAARWLPTVLLFVPSRAGRSHCPEEYTDPVHLAQATDALCQMVIQG